VTRRLIEGQLEAIERRLPHRWWMPYALLAAGVAAGLLLSRIPVLALVGAGARTVQAGLAVAGAAAAVDRFLAERRGHRLAA
jgi:hypothetical protein